MPYPTLDALKMYVGETVADARHDTTLEAALASAVAKVEQYCLRGFGTDAVATARTYVPDSQRQVEIDDFHSLVGLVVRTDPTGDGTYDTTWTINTDFLVGPRGRDQRPGEPWYQLDAVGPYLFPSPGLAGRATVEVTALWGWAETPQDIYSGVLELAAQEWKRRDAPFGVMGFDDMGAAIRVSTSDMRILGKLAGRRRYGALVG